MSSPDNAKYSTVDIVKTGLSLLTHQERQRAIYLSVALFVASLVDMIAVASVMPLVTMVLDAESLLSNEKVSYVVDLLGNPDTHDLMTIFLSVSLFLLVFSTGLRIFLEYIIGKFTSYCRSRLASTIMEKCDQAPYQWFLKQNSALLSRKLYSDVALISRNFLQSLMMMVGNSITLVIGIVTVVLLAPVAGLIVLGVVSFFSALLLLVTRTSIKRLSVRQRDITDVLTKLTQQVVVGVKDVRLSANSGYFRKLFDDEYDDFARLDAKIKLFSSAPAVIVILLGQVSILFAVVILWKMGTPISIIAAQVTLLLLVSSKVIPAVNRLYGNVSSFWKIYPYVRGVMETINELDAFIEDANGRYKNNVDQKPINEWSRLVLKDVSFSYEQSNKNVLDNINLTIDASKSYGVIGPSGAGKTTLIDIVLGLLEPTGGHVVVDNVPIGVENVRSWMSQVGHVPQSPIIFDDTIRNNVAFGVHQEDIDDDWIWEVLKLANLAELIESFDDGLDTQLGERGVRVSGGQRQRIAIARALYMRPKVLVMDEATSALDLENERAIQQAVDNLHGKLTTIIIAHRLGTVRKCDKLFMLEKGQLRVQGTWEELERESDLFKAFAAGHVMF